MSIERLDKRRKAKKRKKYAALLGIVILLSVILIGIVAFHNLCKLENIEIKGASYYTQDEIKEMVITSKLDEYAPLLYLKGKLSMVAEAPFIDKLDIELVDKNSVCIYVYEKAIIGCVEKMGQYLYFDNAGIVIESSNEHDMEYPLVTGLELGSMVIGEKMNVERDSIIDTILNLTMLIKKNEVEVSRISFDNALEVTLYCGENVVLLGKRTTYDLQLNNLPAILESAQEERLQFDLREYSESNMRVIARPLD